MSMLLWLILPFYDFPCVYGLYLWFYLHFIGLLLVQSMQLLSSHMTNKDDNVKTLPLTALPLPGSE